MKYFTFILSLSFMLSFPGLFAQSMEDTLKIDEVVVTGSKTEINRKNLPVNISVLSKEELNTIHESAALSVVSQRIPGVFVTERGVTGFSIGASSAGQISIRGISGEPNSRVLVLVDGSPQYMGIFGHPFPNSYVTSDLEKVEVIKGPASLLYGSNAMGGAINFITKKSDKEGVSGEASLGYGSFNTLNYRANIAFQKKNFKMFVSYNHDQTDGHRDSSLYRINNAYIKTSYRISKSLEIVADYNIAKLYDEDPGPEGSADPKFTADILRGKASLSLKNNFRNIEGGFTTFYNYGEHSLSDGWHSNDANYGVSFFEGFRLFEGNQLTIGTDYKNFGGRGNSTFPPNDYQDKWVSISEIAGYIFARQNISDFSLSAGLRIENNSNYGNELVPQAGLAYNLSENTNLKASVSKGFRSPLVMETYLFLPNPDLKPESMMNYELGWAQSFLKKRINTEVSLFMLEGKNAIETIPNSTPPPMVKRANTGSFTHKGFEIENRILITKSLSSELNYSYLNMKSPRLGAPENMLFAALNYRLGKLSFTLQANYVSGLYSRLDDPSSPAISEVLKENYLLINAGIKYRPLKWAEIFVSGKNLLDEEYQINYGYPMPGVNIMTGLNLKF